MSSSSDSVTVKSPPQESKDQGGRTAFVYGTLMVPQILHRVCHGTENPHPELISHLHFTPALLRDFSRRKVLGADYPGIIAQPSHSVLGTLVRGLSDADVRNLDSFEGGMYVRQWVEVQVLEAEVFDKDGEVREEEMEKVKGVGEEAREMCRAETYVWCMGEEHLMEGEWSYADFRREKMGDWVYGMGEEYEDLEHGDGDLENGGDDDVVGEDGALEASIADMVAKILGAEDVDGEEQEKQRIASVVARIAAQEAEEAEAADEAEVLKSAV